MMPTVGLYITKSHIKNSINNNNIKKQKIIEKS